MRMIKTVMQLNRTAICYQKAYHSPPPFFILLCDGCSMEQNSELYFPPTVH